MRADVVAVSAGWGRDGHGGPAEVLVAGHVQPVLAHIAGNGRAPRLLASILVGYPRSVLVVVLAENPLGAGVVVRAVGHLLHAGDFVAGIGAAQQKHARMVAARCGLEGVAGHIVVHDPEIAPHFDGVGVAVAGGNDVTFRDAQGGFFVMAADGVDEIALDGLLHGDGLCRCLHCGVGGMAAGVGSLVAVVLMTATAAITALKFFNKVFMLVLYFRS